MTRATVVRVHTPPLAASAHPSRSAPARDDAHLIRRSLIPWEALSETEREEDRQAVLALAAVLRGEGWVLGAATAPSS